jgi:oxalate decarboxylase/phosphoglucose isomerase-like protein (cupin superfamily)
MLKRLAILFTLSVLVSALWATDESSLPAVYKSAAELMATLAKNAQARPDQADSPIVNQDHYRINIVRRGSPGTAMSHATGPAKGSELHYIIDGAATVITGGTIVRPPGAATKGAGSATIEGGQSRRVSKGDVIFIPAGTPHWYKDVEGSVTYLEVRFDVELNK